MLFRGFIFYDNQVIDIAANLKPSARGELEVTDVNRTYMERGELSVQKFSRGFAWLDTGTKDSLLDACNFVAAVEKRQGLKIACLEEIALQSGFVAAENLVAATEDSRNDYDLYVRSLVLSMIDSK